MLRGNLIYKCRKSVWVLRGLKSILIEPLNASDPERHYIESLNASEIQNIEQVEKQSIS